MQYSFFMILLLFPFKYRVYQNFCPNSAYKMIGQGILDKLFLKCLYTRLFQHKPLVRLLLATNIIFWSCGFELNLFKKSLACRLKFFHPILSISFSLHSLLWLICIVDLVDIYVLLTEIKTKEYNHIIHIYINVFFL